MGDLRLAQHVDVGVELLGRPLPARRAGRCAASGDVACPRAPPARRRTARPAGAGTASSQPWRAATAVGTHGWPIDMASRPEKRSGAVSAARIAGVGAPVVAHEAHLLEPERVEQGDRVVGDPLLAEVVVVRRPGPAEPAQVRARATRNSPASSSITSRHDHQCWGQPCSASTGGASAGPALARWVLTPVARSWKLCSTPSSSGMAGGMSPNATDSSRAMRLVFFVVLALVLAAAPASARTRADNPPGSRPAWAPADKHGFGTSRHAAAASGSRCAQRELTEVYYPDLGTPAIRGLEFVVSRRPDDGGRPRDRRPATGASSRLDGAQLPPDGHRPRAGG